MPNCDHCGFPLPNGAVFCPSCGTAVRRKMEPPVPSTGAILRILQAGVMGAFLSVMIRSFSGIPELYFLPDFVSALIAIYLARTRRLDEAISIALAVYLFSDGIASGINLGILYFQNISLAEAYGDYVITIADVILYAVNPITAVIAGYIGARLTSPTRAREVPPGSYRREEEPGGVIYSLKRNQGKELSTS